ncbi:hypothetical protein CO731_02127 [Aminobacter sp. MSH1]|uniref:hypothetical protein n=1 Tax=Aminobacter sp. MSH1 TaxID=374606 RepID=UPI000D504FDC|nr:hypothetical protein [Aminobacter sp. MSH1]AWC22663.1 hypothetical protein CO731_02127 [Aminobacter sp. MSH1]
MHAIADRSPELRILSEICSAIGATATKLSDSRLSGFLAMKGGSYDGDLMWVGRAVNGWGPLGRTPSELDAIGAVDGFVQQTFESVTKPGSEDHACPMRWVTDHWGSDKHRYNTKTSAFWRTARRVLAETCEVAAEAVDWPSRLIWSNLYKIAPTAGGNPGGKLAAVQLNGCRRLLALEVTTYRPRRLVFATGMDWAHAFLDPAMFHQTSKDSDPVVSGDILVEGMATGRFVVAKHPMGKDENRWVAEVTKALK